MTTAILRQPDHENGHARAKRLSLQPPAGLPQIPRSPSRTPTSATFGAKLAQNGVQQADGKTRDRRGVDARVACEDENTTRDQSTLPGLATRRDSDSSTYSDSSSDLDENTLMGCMMHLSVSSLPPIPCTGNDEASALPANGITSGPLITRFPPPPKPTPSSALGTREQQRKVYLGPKLSDRATGGPDAGPLIERFSCLFKDQYHCKTNPKGIVSMGVAENFMMQAECIEMFTNAFEQGLRSADLSYGDNLWGSRRLNAALAGFYNQYFDPAVSVLPEHLITADQPGNGCSAVLDQLFYSLMDEGEAVLVAAPYYTGFDRDLIPRARVRLVPVDIGISDPAFEPGSMVKFSEKLEELKAEGVVTRAVILCNPQNPLGRTYPRSTLIAYAKWCEANDVHLVSDEIYAMSVYESPHPVTGMQEGFTSLMSLRDEELGEGYDRARLHVVYGMSKDFCANGLRVGSLVSQANPMLLRTMANTSMLMKTDIIWSHILTFPSLLSCFLAENKRRLTEAHTFISEWFTARGVRASYSNAGNFVWVNLGDVVGIKSGKEEKRVFQRLLDGGVYIAPGMAYHCNEPGWFRVTFTIARDDLLVGLAKIEDILGLEIKA